MGTSIKENETPGLDCAVVKTKFPGIYSISTTDFFYPSVDDPYVQGKIAACNVLSDMYAMGVTEVDTMLMILGVSVDMEPDAMDYVTKELIRGFNDQARVAVTNVTGGQTVRNPWPMIGGVASSTCREGEDFIRPVHGEPGDVIVLTKPLGTQLAVNMFEWLRTAAKFNRVRAVLSVEDVVASYKMAMESMSTLNLEGARLMWKHHAHGCTDVTGFGVTGHAMNLAAEQEKAVDLVVDTLPIIKNMARVESHLNNNWNLFKGRSAETSGGLMIMMRPEDAEAYIKEYKEITGHDAWIIGKVVEGQRKGYVVENPTLIEVTDW